MIKTGILFLIIGLVHVYLNIFGIVSFEAGDFTGLVYLIMSLAWLTVGALLCASYYESCEKNKKESNQ